MRILVLTSISPVIAGDAYAKIANHFQRKHNNKIEKKVEFLCYPFFAEISSNADNREYIPTFFAMLRASLDKDMQKKLFKRDNVVVIGNTYKKQDFDMVVKLDDINSEVFDSYIETIKTDKDMDDFAKLVDINNLFTPEDAELNLPTIDHVILFLEEAFYGGKTNSRIKQ